MPTSPAIANPGEELFGSAASLDLSALGQCLNGTAERWAESGINRERIHIRHAPIAYDGEALPLHIVSPYLLRPNPGAGTNTETAVDFQVMLSSHWAGGRDSIGGLGYALAGMQDAIKLFSKKPNSWLGFTVDAGGACLRDATVDAAEALNIEAWQLGVTARFLIINYRLRLGYAGAN